MMKLKTVALGAGLALMAGCASYGGSEMDDDMPDYTPMPGAIPAEWTASIRPMTSMGHGGAASARTEGNSTVVWTTLSRGTGGTHPWHIHRGTCGSGGPIVGSPSAYPALTPREGEVETKMARIDVRLSPSESYYVNIHQSSSAMGTIVGCGQLMHR